MTEKAPEQIKTAAKPIPAAVGNTLQRKCACGQHTIAGGECSTCSQKGEVFKRTAINRLSQNRDSPETSAMSLETLRSTRQPREPALSPSSKRFDQDFARIKVSNRESHPGYAAQTFPTPSPINLESKMLGMQAGAVRHRNLMRQKADRVIAATEKDLDGGGSTTPDIGSTTPDVGPTTPGVGSTGPATTPGAGSAGPGDASPASATKKKAGVDSFVVKWKKHDNASATNARHRLDFTAKFKKDDLHDPSVAEFRQNAGNKWEVTDGPHKGQKKTTPIRDDDYSRADDTAGHTKADVDFVSHDNPGLPSIDKDDVIDYSFTAEQMIIDTSDGNKEIAKKGPHTATIKGKHPRVYADVPKTL